MSEEREPQDNVVIQEAQTNIIELKDAKITEIIKMESTFGKYVTYKILVGDVPIQKRYNDFSIYYATLRQQWPGIYIPKIPQKQPIGNLDEAFIRQRRVMLQLFLDGLMKRKYLWDSYENSLFMQDQNANSTFKELANLNTEQILQKYSRVFPAFVGQQITFEIKHVYSEFSGFISRIKPMIENFRKMCINFVDAKAKYQNEYQIFLNYVLPEYEKTLLFKSEKKYFERVQKFEIVKHKSFDIVRKYNYDQILIDLQVLESDVDGYQLTFEQISKWEQKILSLENKLRTQQYDLQQVMGNKRNQIKEIFFGSREKEVQKLQISIQLVTINFIQISLEIQNLKQIVDILILVIAKIEIIEYRSEKEGNFYKLLKIMGTLEMEQMTLIQDFWEAILSSNEIQAVKLSKRSLLDSILITSESQQKNHQQIDSNENQNDEVNQNLNQNHNEDNFQQDNLEQSKNEQNLEQQQQQHQQQQQQQQQQQLKQEQQEEHQQEQQNQQILNHQSGEQYQPNEFQEVQIDENQQVNLQNDAQ